MSSKQTLNDSTRHLDARTVHKHLTSRFIHIVFKCKFDRRPFLSVESLDLQATRVLVNFTNLLRWLRQTKVPINPTHNLLKVNILHHIQINIRVLVNLHTQLVRCVKHLKRLKSYLCKNNGMKRAGVQALANYEFTFDGLFPEFGRLQINTHLVLTRCEHFNMKTIRIFEKLFVLKDNAFNNPARRADGYSKCGLL